MRLSAEMYEQITAALKSDGHAERDKRLEPRVGMTGEVMLLNVSDRRRNGVMSVRVRDVSRSGIGLYHFKRFAKDQRFIIQLNTLAGEPIWLVCITAHCRRAEEDRYIIGARIKQMLNKEQVQQVGSQLSNPGDEFTPQDIESIKRIASAILS